MPRAYSISSAAIAAERERVGGDLNKFDISRVVQLDQVQLRPMGSRDVHLRILAASAEHNVDHAALADTVNIAEARGGKIFPGNSAVGEVLAVGAEVKRFKPGDIAITHCNGEPDTYGFPLRIWAYDQPESVGWYGEEAVVGDWQLIPAPLRCGLDLWEIAALPLRAPTAYHLWRRAIGIFRVKISRGKLARLNVMSFGGGVGELFLMLARSEGHRAFFCSGSPERREALEKLGIVGIDQKVFHRFASRDDVRAFSTEVKRLTAGESMHIVCDMLRGPVFDAGLAASARGGVNVSAGWQLSQQVSYNSTILSMKQVTIDHTHYETLEGCEAATELYGSVFRPTVHREIYAFEDLPRAVHEMHLNVQTGIPIIRVASELPKSVGDLVERGFWLVKSEPSAYSWDDLVRDGGTRWDGVRNAQARNNLAAMRKGDLVFFYHSGKGCEIVGVARVARDSYPDPDADDERACVVDLEPVKPLRRPVTLAQIKADPNLATLALVRQSRLSVLPVPKPSFQRILGQGETALPS